MSDYEAIQRVIARYTDAINRRDFAVLDEVFAPDGVWNVDAGDGRVFRFEGPQIRAGISGLVGNSAFTVQLASLPVIEIDGDRARSRCMLFETLEQPAIGARFQNFGLYEDELSKLDGRWVFQSRRFTMKNSRKTPL